MLRNDLRRMKRIETHEMQGPPPQNQGVTKH
jgi:hypothetical protein